jgi:hypothetical protein
MRDFFYYIKLERNFSECLPVRLVTVIVSVKETSPAQKQINYHIKLERNFIGFGRLRFSELRLWILGPQVFTDWPCLFLKLAFCNFGAFALRFFRHIFPHFRRSRRTPAV